MIKRQQRIAMRDLSRLTGEDAETAAKQRIGGRDINLFRVMMHHPDLTRRWTVFAGHVLHKQSLPPREPVQQGPSGDWSAEDAALLQAVDDSMTTCRARRSEARGRERVKALKLPRARSGFGHGSAR